MALETEETYHLREERNEISSLTPQNTHVFSTVQAPNKSVAPHDLSKDKKEGKKHGKYFFERSDRQSVAKPRKACWICGSPDHFKADCPHAGRMAHLISTSRCVAQEPDEEEEEHRNYEYLHTLYLSSDVDKDSQESIFVTAY